MNTKQTLSGLIALTLAACTPLQTTKEQTLEERLPPITLSAEELGNSPYMQLTYRLDSKNPVTTMVHLRQMHTFPLSIIREETKNYTEKEKKDYLQGIKSTLGMVNDIQRDIYKFLAGIRKKGITEIWAEGKISETIPELQTEFAARYYNSIMNFLDQEELYREEIEKGSYEKIKYIPGASTLLEMTQQYTVRPTETFELNEKGILSHQVKSGIKEHIYDNREDYLIKKLVESGKKQTFVIYGGGHNFADNIETWNEKNPSKQLSLIELTPITFPEYLRNRD